MDESETERARSSSLSSLSPTPPRGRTPSPARKRPRLSMTSPAPAALFPSPSPPAAPVQLDHALRGYESLLEGLGDDDFRLLPSSDPAGPKDVQPPLPHERAEGARGGAAEQTSCAAVATRGAEGSDGDAAADDSGVGFLPDVERDEGGPDAEAEPPDGAGDEPEFEGDDLWLEFDAADVGFDQPETFPSSALSAGPPRADKGKGRALPDNELDNLEAQAEPKEEPRLQDFGFASLGGAVAAQMGGGFVFATRKPLVLSDKAMQRARALLEADGEGGEAPAAGSSNQPPLFRTSTPTHAPAAVPPTPSRTHSPAPAPAAAFAMLGFKNAAGRNLNLPSEEAMQRIREQFDAPVTTSPRKNGGGSARLAASGDVFAASPAPDRPGPASRPPSAFALPHIVRRPDQAVGIGTAISSVVAVRAESLDSPTVMRVRPTSVGPDEARPAGPGSAGRRTPLLPVNGEEHIAQGATSPAHDDEKTSTGTLCSSSPSTRAPSPVGPAAIVAAPTVAPAVDAAPSRVAPFGLIVPVPLRPPFADASAAPALIARPASFRPPMLSSASTPSRAPTASFTPLRPSSLATQTSVAGSFSSTPNPLLAQPQRRLNLGMTPRSKPHHLANTRTGTPGGHLPAIGPKTGVKAFVSPFRGGKRPDGLTPMGLKGKMAPPASVKKEVLRSPNKAGNSVPKTSKVDLARREKVKVFELDVAAVERHPLGNFGMLPQTHYYEDLQEMGLPTAILDMDSLSGGNYVFSCGRGVTEAHSALQAVVAERIPEERDFVTLAWVKNHWSLLLWKMASYVRSRPDLLGDWWTFDRAMEQLRYRYEREINRAERSAIKRIQEQDSPASLPLVLCVSQIRWDDTPDDEAAVDGGLQVIVGLELTDGWYRIRTNVDKTLQSACQRGKLVIGSKVAIMGAKLIISGNSTSLAPWHAKLGFQRAPFVAGLNSLSSSGGLVPLLDIVIDRVFPCGYIDMRRGRGTETWGEEEEHARAEEWRRGRKRIEAKLAEEAEKTSHEEDEMVELLREAASSLEVGSSRPAPPSTPPEEPDEVLDRLAATPNKRSAIRKLSPQQLRDCLALASEHARDSRFRAVEELQRELAEKYPPRDVRGFRVLRIRDAREGSRSLQRTAQLTVWDGQSFEESFFRVGQRYMLSNVVPKGSWRPNAQEIALATRRDSRWRKV
ncbi:hypothetical protein Rhopal_000306-T1 [Rhodotorula paludigena]|uniref:Breast cancer 2 susceptibility protein n=1 Tax=Rhodotorula paludigena TaxID=86838 RepID=A0AAV5GDE9_9BASI|nr:hypothetical protein Rhopal_000306-T1 [Rhodotorula paludigena]